MSNHSQFSEVCRVMTLSFLILATAGYCWVIWPYVASVDCWYDAGVMVVAIAQERTIRGGVAILGGYALLILGPAFE